MADREYHERITMVKFGEKGTKVHRFMDAHFWRFGPNHRHVNHHWQGIEKCAAEMVRKYGGDYKKWKDIAELHVKVDFQTPWGNFPVPNISDYDGGGGGWPTKAPWLGNCPWEMDDNKYVGEHF